MKLISIFPTCLWRAKAIKRRIIINRLEKRIKELNQSRDKAKIKNDKLINKNNELEKIISVLKAELKKN